MTDRWTQRPIEEALPELIEQQGRSLRSVAASAGIERAFLHRAMRRQDNKVLNGRHAARLALALDLPVDYFAEARAWALEETLRRDPDARDRLFKRLKARDVLQALQHEANVPDAR